MRSGHYDGVKCGPRPRTGQVSIDRSIGMVTTAIVVFVLRFVSTERLQYKGGFGHRHRHQRTSNSPPTLATPAIGYGHERNLKFQVKGFVAEPKPVDSQQCSSHCTVVELQF